MTVVETRLSVWEALAGRAPGRPTGPADPGLWTAVAERLNPARARPRLRDGLEEAHLISVRGVPYVMLRSPDGARACYLRLAPEELALAKLMDGTRTVARLVAEFARIAGRLAPDQVTRVVADLAGNRMLAELPVDAFRPLDRVHRRPWPVRLGRGLLAGARGRRVVLASVDPLVGFLYRFGGRLLFTRVAAVVCGLVALAGLTVFCLNWAYADQQVFLTGTSYAWGALVLLGLNVLALACHELGHALATKHAGRRVPKAGFLVYFGIPSVFVDTTDVWMAGRRARLLTTAAGPATGLVLAGTAQLVGLAYPPLAPWAFKLSFAWYVNVLFNLNPFLALDGYYLLMDWLEVPNLRARGLAWVIARLRRRPPAFGELDREGRLVALYGMLAVVWLVIAVNIAYRIYTDRITGLVTGLWRSGWTARVLLVAVVAVLFAPVTYALFGWFGRRWRRVKGRLSERRSGADLPRRLRALQSSGLGGLPVPRLTDLAARARWVHPRTGSQLVFAGAAQPDVYVVVDGALEARRPGDPGGTIRERVGPGGVVGLANALTGAAAALAWHTAGTTLLAVPSSAVAAAVGPVSGPPPAERAELEQLLATTPALAALSDVDRLGIAMRARPVSLPPGAPLLTAGPQDAIVVASGVLALDAGSELRRGALIGPLGESVAGRFGVARTAARIWILPAVSGVPLLIGPRSSTVDSPGGGVAPAFGAHPPAGYPPLAAPPGPPPSTVDEDADRRFERKLWWLLILLLLFALLLTGSNLLPGPAWAEMPADRALLAVDRGRVSATVDGRPVVLHAGDQRYLREADLVSVPDRAGARLTFRGGGLALLCAGTDVTLGVLASRPGRPVQPTGQVRLADGRALVDTHPSTRAFSPLRLTVDDGSSTVANSGVARFAVSPGGVQAGEGTVTRDGVPVGLTDAPLTCGDGVALPVPEGTPSGSPSPSDPPSDSPSASPSASPSPSPTPTPTTAGPPTPTKSPTKPPTKPPPPPPTTGPPPPPRDLPPVFNSLSVTPKVTQRLTNGQPCVQGEETFVAIIADISDPDDARSAIVSYYSYTMKGGPSGGGQMGPDGAPPPVYGSFFAPTHGTIPESGGTIVVTVSARDPAGNVVSTTRNVTVDQCIIIT